MRLHIEAVFYVKSQYLLTAKAQKPPSVPPKWGKGAKNANR